MLTSDLEIQKGALSHIKNFLKFEIKKKEICNRGRDEV